MKNLEPSAVWAIFEEITRVPRPSKKEARITAWLVDFATRHGLRHRTDEAGNVVILSPATPGMEAAPTVVLQNHVDMVCEKNADAVNDAGEPFDFERDPIRTRIDGEWLRARGTTLGADNGIGMALALALLISDDEPHGPLEALFTVDEETGLTGASGLGPGMITGRYLINLDSEDEGEVFIGCAGGIDTVGVFECTPEPAPPGLAFYGLTVSGLRGGHSGDDIEKMRGNSNRILARALWAGITRHGLRLAQIDGGNLRNAIPREARALIALPTAEAPKYTAFIKDFAADIATELTQSDPGVQVSMTPAPPAATLIDEATTRRLTAALIALPNGPLAMSQTVPGLVETSSNLASVKTEGKRITVTTSQRSSLESAKTAAAGAIEALLTMAGATVTHSEGYPGWAPDPNSTVLEITKNAYRKLFRREIKTRAIHAGLECGLLLKKYPNLEMISTGPTITGAHSPDESLHIPTVTPVWQLLLEILRNLPPTS